MELKAKKALKKHGSAPERKAPPPPKEVQPPKALPKPTEDKGALIAKITVLKKVAFT